MKKYNMLFYIAAIIYLCFSAVLLGIGLKSTGNDSMAYKVEVHEVMQQLEQGEQVSAIDLSSLTDDEIDLSKAQYSPREAQWLFQCCRVIARSVQFRHLLAAGSGGLCPR